jgi:hypothetical protein
LGTVLLLALIWAVAHGVNNGWRFGRVFGPARIVDDAAPYRSSTHRDVQYRGVPKTIWLASITSTIWGIITLAIFFPAGGLLALIMLFSGKAGVALGGLPLFVICFAGLGLGIKLLQQSGRLLRRDGTSAERLVRWSLAHHASVLLYFVILGFAVEGPGGVAAALIFAGIPCFVGVLQAAALSNAGQRLRVIEREEEAGVALPPELSPIRG